MSHSENVNRARPIVAWISSTTSGTDAHQAARSSVEVRRHARYTTLATRAASAIARIVYRRRRVSGPGRDGSGTGPRNQPKASSRTRAEDMARVSDVVRRRAMDRSGHTALADGVIAGSRAGHHLLSHQVCF